MFGRATDGYVRWSGALIRKSGVALVMLVVFGVAAAFFSRQSAVQLPARRRSGLRVHVNLQLPMRPRFERTDEVARKVEKILAQTPGVKYTTRCRLQPAQLGADQLQRVLLRHAEGLEGAQEPRGAVSGHQAAPEPGAQQASGGHSRSTSRRRRFPASAPPADSPSFSKTAPARMSSSWRTT